LTSRWSIVDGCESIPGYSAADMLKYVAYQLDENRGPAKLSHKSTWQTLDQQLAIGFYWIMSHNDHGRRLRYSGGTLGFSSFCDLYPDEQLGIVLLANSSSERAQDKLKEVSENIVDAIHKSALHR
jgi:D-alanyl-D-alanine-carboxypeptidase/D-alanyl-D-alanine-endopeptidase